MSRKYLVIETMVTTSQWGDLVPSTDVDIYGVYSSYKEAIKGVEICATHAEKVYSVSENTKYTSVRIVEEPYHITTVQQFVTRYESFKSEYSYKTRLIDVRIREEC